MRIFHIHNLWGTIIEFDNPLDFFNYDADFWRKMIYDRKLIVFKKMNFEKSDYVKFGYNFGKPWQEEDYNYSREKAESVLINGNKFTISPMSNKISTLLGMEPMAWHSDIPNKSEKPFPIRSLWITKNPNPESGLTTWMNVEQGLDILPDDLKKQIEHIKIIQQSWYREGTDVKEFDFIKNHPITNNPSLRLNYFNDKTKGLTNAWIKCVRVLGMLVDNCKAVLGPYLKWMQGQHELVYTHKWDTYDIAIYDNFPLLHNRTRLQFDPDLERLFFRVNIDHVPDAEWANHKTFVQSNF